MYKFQIWERQSRLERVINACGSHWSRMQRFMALSKMWSQEKVGIQPNFTLLAEVVRICFSLLQIYKSWKGKKGGLWGYLLAPQGCLDSMNVPCSAGGARRRWWTLSADLGHVQAEGIRDITQAFLGGWFTSIPTFLTSVAAKQTVKKHANYLTLIPISPLEALLLQQFWRQGNAFFSPYEEFVLISDEFIFSCGDCNHSSSIFLDLSFLPLS